MDYDAIYDAIWKRFQPFHNDWRNRTLKYPAMFEADLDSAIAEAAQDIASELVKSARIDASRRESRGCPNLKKTLPKLALILVLNLIGVVSCRADVKLPIFILSVLLFF